jgi:hypothetical protein
MKRLVTFLFGALFAAVAFAQTPAAVPVTPFVKGTLSIRFDTRTQLDGDKPRVGVTDKYKLHLNVSDSVVFDGTIESLPFVKKSFGSNQAGLLTHSIECMVVNPRNTAQTRNIGRLFGTVPVDEQNVYRFEDGNLKIGIFGAGGAQGFESKVKGLALGKPPAGSEGFLSKTKKDILRLTKMVGDKQITLPVTKYDQMTFQSHVLSAGPVMVYPEATVNGPLIYDYDRTAWYFNNVTVNYTAADEKTGRMMVLQDRLSGNIRWVESPDRATSGQGEYQFDIRVNEPLSTEAQAFTGPADESAFFASDNAVPALTGTMKYKDTIINDVVTSSTVIVDLKGNQLTKQQVMYLSKLLMMSSIVPINAE